jgi:hypothetical protein
MARNVAAGLGIVLAAAAVGLGMGMPRNEVWQSLTVATVKLAALAALWLAAWFSFRWDPALSRARRWVLVALAFEGLCDFSIEFSLVAGGAASTLGMVFYSLAFLAFPQGRHGKAVPLIAWAVLLTVFFVLVAWGARTVAGQTMGWPDLTYSVYMAVLSTAVSLSLSRNVPWGGRLAILLFYVSDYFVYFGGIWGRQPGLALANGLTYYPAQLLFAVGLGIGGRNKP